MPGLFLEGDECKSGRKAASGGVGGGRFWRLGGGCPGVRGGVSVADAGRSGGAGGGVARCVVAFQPIG